MFLEISIILLLLVCIIYLHIIHSKINIPVDPIAQQIAAVGRLELVDSQATILVKEILSNNIRSRNNIPT